MELCLKLQITTNLNCRNNSKALPVQKTAPLGVYLMVRKKMSLFLHLFGNHLPNLTLSVSWILESTFVLRIKLDEELGTRTQSLAQHNNIAGGLSKRAKRFLGLKAM